MAGAAHPRALDCRRGPPSMAGGRYGRRKSDGVRMTDLNGHDSVPYA